MNVRTVWRWLEEARTEGRVERRPRARLELSDQAWEVLAQAGGNVAVLHQHLKDAGGEVSSLASLYRVVRRDLEAGKALPDRAVARREREEQRTRHALLTLPWPGSGKSYSAQALAAAGLRPGETFTQEGTVFRRPDVPAGKPDNVPATGQLIRLDASGATLAVLAAAAYGAQGGTGTVHYADGTSAPYTLRVDDWYATSSSTGARAAAVLAYNNGPSGRIAQPVTFWRTDIALRQGARIGAVELLSTGTLPRGCVHVFALSVV
ncbi:hypothetical protein ACWD4L_31725 [Streptomyces sp. NPDC002596]